MTSPGFAFTTGLVTGLMLLSGSAILPGRGFVNAQVIPDGTLPTIVTPIGNSFTIDGGTRSGTNLFHSFSQFSVPLNGSAVFNNATDIQTIFSRVTGGSVSNIDGLIQANGTANLFLLNPSGILFGPNASLNIGGSFISTTANSIKFADGVEFSAVNPTAKPLLTISVPIGLQLGQNSGAITVQGRGHRLIETSFYAPLDQSVTPTGLTVQPGKTLAFIGNSIALTGGILTAPSGHIELGSVSLGTVNLNTTLPQWAFDYSQTQQFADIRLSQQALVNASGAPAGSLQLQGRNISLLGGSVALIQNFGGDALGDLVVNATGLLEMKQVGTDGFPNNWLLSETLGTGAGSNLNISAQNLEIQDGGVITTKTFTAGRGGDIKLAVANTLSVDGWSSIDPTVASVIGAATLVSGEGGKLSLVARQVSLTNGGSILNLTSGTGRVGKMTVVATDQIEVSGENPIIERTSALATATLSQGNSGDLSVTASVISLQAGGGIGTSTLAAGNSGTITVNASNRIEVSGISPTSGQQSRIVSKAELLPEIQRQAYGLPLPTGNAGELTVNTPFLQVSDRGTVAVNNDSTGDAGNLKINADRVVLGRQGNITATTQSGVGGNILLNIQDRLMLRHGSAITATARGTGNGGNISINAPVIMGLENSDIIANAVKGRGGNIDITTQGVFGLKYRDQLTPNNDITASSEFGVNGTVDIITPGIDPNSGLITLPGELVDPSQQIAQNCAANQGSSFVISGRGGMHENPINQFSLYHPWADLRSLSSERHPLAQTPSALLPTPPLVEAVGWRRNRAGQMELFAAAQPTTELTALPVTCAGGK